MQRPPCGVPNRPETSLGDVRRKGRPEAAAGRRSGSAGGRRPAATNAPQVSVRVPGGSALITMAHRPSAARAVRLREASEMGRVAGSAPAAISVRGGRTLVDTGYSGG